MTKYHLMRSIVHFIVEMSSFKVAAGGCWLSLLTAAQGVGAVQW